MTHPKKLQNRSFLRSLDYRRVLSSFPIWRGPSEIDGAPMVCAISNMTTNCDNDKIAEDGSDEMVQVWYLREDIPPQDVFKQKIGSACGDCQHMNDQSCYVTWFRSPLSVWKAVKEKEILPVNVVQELCRDLVVRLGAGGDPASVPAWVSAMPLELSKGHLGYTHQWHTLPIYSPLKDICMASVDSPFQARLAQDLGWRTFRSESANGSNWDLGKSELECLATSRGITCEKCRLCSGVGNNREKVKNIKIAIHGPKASNYRQDDSKFLELRNLVNKFGGV